MKKLINYIFGVSLIFLLAACSEKEFVRPVINLELLQYDVELNITSTELTTATVVIKHGNSGYTVESSDETVATATNAGSGVEIVITAVGQGIAVITVTDSEGKTASIDVTVVVKTPTSPTFTWAGQNIWFDRAGGYAITVLANKIAFTDIANENKQYVIAWTGGLSQGEKTNATLKIITQGLEPNVVELNTFRILESGASIHYIVFSDGNNGGQLYFSTE